MRRFLLILTAMLTVASQAALAWSDIGHAAVGKVAQDHLTPKAAKALSEYLGGLPLSAVASDADKYRSQWVMDLGFVPTNPDFARLFTSIDPSLPLNMNPWSHSITVDENLKPYPTDNLDGAYINNDVYYIEVLSEKLRKEAETMDPEERYRAICLITHFMGDMHCPVHVVYQNFPRNKGKFNVTYKGKKMNYHSFWDGTIFAFGGWGYMELAYAIDSASKKEIKAITAGTVRDWGEDAARQGLKAFEGVGPDTVLPATFPYDMRPLLYSQLRNAGYRLAAQFNGIFK